MSNVTRQVQYKVRCLFWNPVSQSVNYIYLSSRR